MFQVGNPLQPFSRNPNQDDSDDVVPSLAESQTRVRESNKIISGVIQYCLIILVAILLLTIGLSVYNRIHYRNILPGDVEEAEEGTVKESESHWEKETDEGKITIDTYKREEIIEEKYPAQGLENCSDCINFAQLKMKVETNVIEAEQYLREKILQVRKINVDTQDEAALVVPEDINSKMVNVPLLLEKINQLLSLNGTFTKAFNAALASQQELQRLERIYGNKVSGIENLSSDMINYIKATYAFKRLEDESKQNITLLDEKIKDEVEKLEVMKKEARKNIDKLKDQVHDDLREFGVRSEQGLIDKISEIHSKIDNIERESVKCEQEIVTKNEQIIILETEYNKNIQQLEEIIDQTNQLYWVRHVLATIRKFEEVRDRLKSLQEQQLKAGKEHFEKLLDLMTQKKKNYVNLLSENKQPKTVIVKEEKTSYENEENQKVTKKQTYAIFEQSSLEKAEIIRRSMEKEKTLLKVWAYEQFNTYLISKNEISNMTSLIETQQASIKEQSKDYEIYSSNLTYYENLNEKIMIELKQQREVIKRCEDTMHNSESGKENLQSGLEEINKLSNQINETKTAIKEFEEDFSVIETNKTNAINNLKKMQKSIQNTLNEMKRNKDSPELHLKALTRTINKQIVTGPVPEVVEKKVAEYKVKVEKANEVFQQLSALVEEIKSIV